MGYSNYFSLKVKTDEKVKVGRCENIECSNNRFHNESKFCPDCGHELVIHEVDKDVNELIGEFRESSEEAKYLLDDGGSSEECGSGYTIKEDLIKFSETYPNSIFELYCEWDQGFGDPPSKIYVKNGKSQECHAELLFPPFDETKLV